MAVSQTTRFAQTRWSAAADPFTRAQMDDDHAQIEAKAAGRIADLFANRPAAGAANEGFFFWATDTKAMSYSDGAAWQELGGGGSWARSFLTGGN